ncbi:hypothetical protein HL658_27500 [Azospirillum sp. RWY-5-1]|uniref:Uncharacterized protein n=1 Tax=Azospirillum oleiclasticum TaxID=2735135 RepID=A0ABX2THQ8_9PROT|nr:hypothetical protein [Azospirillum oleiclasticum]NYZ16304.1 hypothetical protein [Azospirillum oleiclasticum]NYZ23791.1 hypothetical protein [Azospirillum oleiclasticum]
MPQRDSIRRAIDELEGTAAARAEAGLSVLERLYTTYAQATLTAHGIHIDLIALCDDRAARPAPRAAEPSH